ncbi:histidine kinase [Janibacter alkaliphilus]
MLRLLRSTTWRSVLWVLVCVLAATMAAATFDGRRGGSAEEVSDLGLLVWLVGILLAVSVVWRRRWPHSLGVLAAVVTIAAPLDPVAGLVLLMHAVMRERSWRTAALTALVLAATWVSTWRDLQGRTHLESFWRIFSQDTTDMTPPDQGPAPWWLPPVIAVAMVAAAVATGWFRSLLAEARQEGADHQAQAHLLGDQVARQTEREQLAREVHDALGHRLSVMAIHAGALEAHSSSSTDPLARSARLVRESASQANADLRDLLATLRSPDEPTTPQQGIDAVGDLVDESVESGMPLIATVRLDDTRTLHPQVSRSVYRMVQELLTNARTHAPGHGVRLVVRASAAAGIDIETANHVSDPHRRHSRPAGGSSGHGLPGIHERVQLVEGEMYVWLDDDQVHRVAIHLPWVPAGPAAEQVASGDAR